LSGDAKKLSANLQSLVDLLGEADFWRAAAAARRSPRDDVQQAIDAQLHRADRLRAQVHEAILRGTLMIDTDGAKVGQVNGLVGVRTRELRIRAAYAHHRDDAARRWPGDRCAARSGTRRRTPFQGRNDLASFLAARYCTNRRIRWPRAWFSSRPMARSRATVHQPRELARCSRHWRSCRSCSHWRSPRSINQLGQVQAIGAVNEKIEVFSTFAARGGLNGSQARDHSASNVDNLMLRGDVVQAVRDGKFSIHAVAHVDQAIELLTGVAAGAPDAAGNWPDASRQRPRGEAFCAELAELRQKFTTGGKRERGALPGKSRGRER